MPRQRPLLSKRTIYEHFQTRCAGIQAIGQDSTFELHPKKTSLGMYRGQVLSINISSEIQPHGKTRKMLWRLNPICSYFRGIGWLITIVFFRCYSLHIVCQSSSYHHLITFITNIKFMYIKIYRKYVFTLVKKEMDRQVTHF